MRGQGDDRARTMRRLATGLALSVTLAACTVVLARGGAGLPDLEGAGLAVLAFEAFNWASNRAWSLARAAGDWARQGYADHPAVMLGLASGAALPLIAVAKGVSRSLARRREMRALTGSTPIGDRLAMRRRGAWIEVEDGSEDRFYLGELTTIGSGEECDLQTRGANRAETYAVVKAAGEGEFMLIDMSGGLKTALRVNGRAVVRGILEDGDRIEIGASRFVFRQPPPTTLHLRPLQAREFEAQTESPAPILGSAAVDERGTETRTSAGHAGTGA